MNKTSSKQKPKKREYFKVNTLPLQLEKTNKEIDSMPPEEIAKKIPDEMLRAIYRGLLVYDEELHGAKTYKQLAKVSERFLNKLLKNPHFWKYLTFLTEMTQKTKQKDEPEKVRWTDNGKKKKKK